MRPTRPYPKGNTGVRKRHKYTYFPVNSGYYTEKDAFSTLDNPKKASFQTDDGPETMLYKQGFTCISIFQLSFFFRNNRYPILIKPDRKP